MHKIRHLFFIFLFLVLVSGCATVYNPATERKEFIFIDTNTEVALGKMMLSQVKAEYKISQDSVLNERLNSIGKKVALQSDRQDLNYIFSVIEDKELNAFAMPGGFIFVNSGLLDKATDHELACVVAHEIGHIAAKHPVKRLQTVLGYQILIGIAFKSAGASVDLARALDVIFNVVALGYSREDERFADKLAVRYAYKAGFEPETMISFFKKLKEEKEKGGPALNLVFLSSHPPLEERIKNVQEQVNIVKGKKEISQPKPKSNPTNPTDNFTSSPESDKKSKSTITATRKVCPKCKKIFSSQYNFCPQDGDELIIP